MHSQVNSFNKIPVSFINKWQQITDLLAKLIRIPATLIMKTENEFMEVFISSNSEGNPYHVGDKEPWYGLYCETVIKTQQELLVPNALKDKNWGKNPDIKLGMIAYCGFPLNFPDGTPFGTICILDNKENPFSKDHENILLQFKYVIELDLGLIQSINIKESHTAVQQLLSRNTELEQAKNIAEEKEKQLKESENNLKKLNAAKDIFLTVLAHDLKNPFFSLLGYSELLLDNIHKLDIQTIEKQVSTINEVANQTYNLLEELLLWSKSQSGTLVIDKRNINLKETCIETMALSRNEAEAKDITINCYVNKDIILPANENMIKIVVRNLISNAIKYTKPKGQVKILAEKNHKNVTITVSDNGVGINEENIQKIWDVTEHYSTKGTANESGTGFGLIFCKEFIEKHGGEIWIESEPGKGSDFIFTMPL